MRIFVPLLLSLFIALAGCEGEVGPAGPEGPAGPSGPSGPQGPPGNANVQVVNRSVYLNVTSGYADEAVSVSEITTGLIENGVVVPYIRSGNNTWTPLPWSYLAVGNCFIAFNPAVYPGGVQLVFQNECGGNDDFSVDLRMVLIAGPGGFVQGDAPPAYAELAARYDLPLD